jgi:hypothetical protein
MGAIVIATLIRSGMQHRWILTAAVLIILTSCSGSGRGDGAVLTSPRPPLTGAGGTAAQVGGTLVYEEDTGCLFLGGDNVRIPVVWPAGAYWQSDPPAVKLQGQTIEPGMSVSGGGGFHQYEIIKGLAGAAVAGAAQACVGPTGEIAFFNIGSKVELVTDQ